MIGTNITDCNQTQSLLEKMIKGSNIPPGYFFLSFFVFLLFCGVRETLPS